jgi:hypothetical protein
MKNSLEWLEDLIRLEEWTQEGLGKPEDASRPVPAPVVVGFAP